MKGLLYLEDGTIYIGEGIGKKGTSVGELVFNTSTTGYEEVLTDPSYAGQVINMCYPFIGNYGVNNAHKESSRSYARGIVVKSICDTPSNYLSQKSLNEFLKEENIVGVCGLDTRSITKKIRNFGSMKCVISNEDLSIHEIKEIMLSQGKENLVQQVSVDCTRHIKGEAVKIAVLDFGVKKSIIKDLTKRGCEVTIFPYNSFYDEIMSINPDGVLLSNGPGDPKDVLHSVQEVKKLIDKVPIFGVCLGHQILTLALGGNTYKMKFGHRGGNHGVYDIEKDKAYITSQNHGYAVEAESLKDLDVVVTHINLNDRTIEGIRHKSLPVFSVQFHPEGAPGPTDTSYLFDKFIKCAGERL
ncbi:glutamine-hydrolyzing carbamoyl-phosphate synthase small subunit [Clostridium lundense]|uniref:glutamine-hydrolyzing carbamoyl-phosphate synthase small subunit n=1 Tax=Clostridium lundense TaxID=319475 RepID=UPI0004898217|nr:glutamine-hydrolyzing carbamoyl-phosphate synthase small subunit [Clostridium lundense]